MVQISFKTLVIDTRSQKESLCCERVFDSGCNRKSVSDCKGELFLDLTQLVGQRRGSSLGHMMTSLGVLGWVG